jgi:predicted flap endonuclease-1-like 5' DNA nuclease
MGLFDIIRSLLGGDDRDGNKQGSSDHRRDRPRPETGTEASVKGTDDSPEHDEEADADPVAADTDAAGSTGSLVDPPESAEDTAEPAEAAGPTPETPEAGDVEPDTDHDAVATPTPETPEEGPDLESVSGIGPAYATRLNEAGVRGVSDLLEADATAVAEETGISEKRISRWQERAG